MSLYDFQLLVHNLERLVESRGTPAEWDFYLLVENRLAEYTSDYISAQQLIDALREDLAERDLASPAA